MEKIASNEAVAQSAVSGIKNISVINSQSCFLNSSNISSMKDGVEVCNRLLVDLSDLVDCVKKQADKFPEIAAAISIRDRQVIFN